MAETNVPEIEFTPAGLVVPDEATVLAGVQADYNEAFGGNLNPALSTPQGQLATSTSAIIAAKNAQFAEFVNQVNPDTASGFMQDAIARIYLLERLPGAPTVVQCLCNGQFNVIIPANAQATDTSGNRYVCVDGGRIPISGNITLAFANVLKGPIPCPANTLTRISLAIPGWDSINNPTDGVLGADVESQSQFAYRRQQSVARNGQGSLPSVYAAVFEVPDVLDVYVTENVTGSTVNTGPTAYPLVEHSLYVAVVGGSNDAVARAIWNKKGTGCDYNGNTTVVVTDDSGYSPPAPTYPVTFERPSALPIMFAVEIADDPGLPADIITLVQAAIIAAFIGEAPGSTRARIGARITASTYYGYVQATDPSMSVLSILIGTVTPTLTVVNVGINQVPTIDASNISVTLV